MGIYARAKKSFSPVKEGLHLGVLRGVYDIGTIHNKQFNSDHRKIILEWELPEDRIVMTRDNEMIDAPRLISKVYTLSMSKRANLRGDIESWRGRAFRDDDDAECFDVCSLLGQNCLINVIHSFGSGGRTYANIDSIVPTGRGQKPVEAEGTLIGYSIEQDGAEIPEATPQWIKDKIMESPEYDAIRGTARGDDDLPDVIDNASVPEEEVVPASVARGEYLKASEQSECPF